MPTWTGTRGRTAALVVGIALAVVGCSTGVSGPGGSAGNTDDSARTPANSSRQATSPTGNADFATRTGVESAMQATMSKFHLKALIVRVTRGGEDVYTAALGESMTGVPATPDMHFRNGAFAFSYIGQIVAKLVDARKVSLDDKLSTWFPQYPRADRITVKNLLNMTSGYADYVYQPALGDSINRDPFKQWTDEELLAIAFAAPEQFEPGTNWGYSHTNYVILTQVLQRITGKPMSEVMNEYIIGPMRLSQTSGEGGTPAISDPVLHTFTAERSEYFQVPEGKQVYEEGTFWNPSWTTGSGAVQTSDIYDVTTSMEIIGSGSQVSPEMHAAQTSPQLIGFGSPAPGCSACRANTEAMSYGLGVILLGPWITQTKSFAGSAATSGYLPSQRLTVSVAMTYTPEAFADAEGFNNSSWATFAAVAGAVAPGQAPERG